MATSSSDRIEAARKALEDFNTYEHDYEVMGRIAEALRALIEPDAVNETAEQVADRIADKHQGLYEDLRSARQTAAHDGYRAGIQAAWESWEPETAPGSRIITGEQYEGVCAAIDRVKLDERNLDTDEYAGMVLEALGLGV